MKNDPKTSWDSFSYTLQMAHNVWMHITAVQEANEAYDKGIYPSMYDSNTSKLFGLKLSRTEPSRTEPNIFTSKIRGVGILW